MTFTIQADAPPLHEDDSGGLRIGETRVLLELAIRALQDGATPETIVQRYAPLKLSDVYAVIAYYLRHQGEIDEYLSHREQKAQQVERMVESGQGDLSEIRTRLLRQRK